MTRRSTMQLTSLMQSGILDNTNVNCLHILQWALHQWEIRGPHMDSPPWTANMLSTALSQ
eukprot:6198249-Pleurochrysis_carterae.AAC.1